MQKKQILILATSITAILILLVVAVYFLINSNTNEMTSMMGSASTNNWLIPLVLIVIAIILAMAIVLYFVYPKKERSESTLSNIDYAKTREKLSTANKKPDIPDIEVKPFDVFLCYKKSSGKDYADHLKAGLEELGLHTFEDCKDIPQTVDTEEGWAMFRDKALEQSKFFVLIMTPGFDLSSEVVKEIGMARKQDNKTFVFFRHRSMPRNIVVNLENEILDIGKLEQVSFESKEELLRLAHNILFKA